MNLPSVLICAYQPTATLRSLVFELKGLGFPFILILNDGSTTGLDILNELHQIHGVRVANLATNRGKGTALKAGFRWFLEHPEFTLSKTVVCMDSDGQHLAEDALKVAKVALAESGTPVFGVRTFTRQTPFRNRIGNKIGAVALKYFMGLNLRDSQTGLRAIPIQYLSALCRLSQERFDFEMGQIAYFSKHRIPIKSVPIRTIYDHGGTSHFKIWSDSLLISRTMIRSQSEKTLP